MASVDPLIADHFGRDLRLVQADVQAGVIPSRSRTATAHWTIWADFCSNLHLDPTLPQCRDPIPFLQVFARRYRTGAIAPRGQPVRSRTVEDALCNVAQAFTSVGASDPCLTSQGHLDFRLQRQLTAYSKADPPPHRVKPVPIPILQHLMHAAILSNDPSSLAVADMITIAFFFLLRPGEYTGLPSDTTPFRNRSF